MTPAMRRQIDAAAARIERMTSALAGSDVLKMGEIDRSLGDATGPTSANPLLDSLVEIIESVEAACANLLSSRSEVHRRLRGRTASSAALS